MFDRLVDLIIQFAELFRFWYVLQPYEQGVLVRLGKFVRVMEPGFHWVAPLSVDVVHYESVVPTTHSLGNESITTKDGKAVSFHAVVTFQIADIEKVLLSVHDTDHALVDACRGEVARTLMAHTWDEIVQDSIYDDLTKACRKRGWRWGIEVMSVQLAGLSLARNIRLISNGV